ncbi:MAG: patatin-like phospholipase family protein [Thermoleophilaceae bacterium]
MAERIRVLSIDGGGMRGIIPALVLAELERRAGRPVADLFDLVAGTSTGGILALALAQPGPDGRPARTAEQLVELYETEGPRIFSRNLLQRIRSVEGLADERYSAEGLDRALKRYLGDTRLAGRLDAGARDRLRHRRPRGGAAQPRRRPGHAGRRPRHRGGADLLRGLGAAGRRT